MTTAEIAELQRRTNQSKHDVEAVYDLVETVRDELTAKIAESEARVTERIDGLDQKVGTLQGDVASLKDGVDKILQHLGIPTE